MEIKKDICKNETSLWLATTPATEFEQLPEGGGMEFDTTVVGAGIAGITTALLLKKSGLKVALIDSERIAAGVSGYTTGKVTAQHIVIYSYLIEKFGKKLAKQYAGANFGAIKMIKELIDEYSIECDFFEKTAYTYAETSETLKQIYKELEAAKSLGLPAYFTKDVPLPIPSKGAICFSGQGQFHPRKYLLALAGQIPGRGSQIFEKTRALTLKEGSPCTLYTDRGQIISENIVISTHFPFYDKPGQYYARMEAGRIYTFAMRLNSPFPDGVFISAEKDIYSFRSQPYENSELVIAGGQEHVTGQVEDTSERFRLLYSYVKQFFDIDHIEFCWSSQDNNTIDMVPYIGRYLPDSRHIYIATGFNGWGMTHGTISAIILNSLITGSSSPWQEVYDPSRFKLSRSGEKTLQETSAEDISKEDKKIIKEPENILSGMDVKEGRIIDIEGTKIAVYKTRENEGIFLSPACTHMNCLVRFNDAEKSWDCPCHGSRFTFDGKVLNSPAIEALPVILDLRKNDK